jgi:ABC-type multidrug transport system permease subunit
MHRKGSSLSTKESLSDMVTYSISLMLISLMMFGLIRAVCCVFIIGKQRFEGNFVIIAVRIPVNNLPGVRVCFRCPIICNPNILLILIKTLWIWFCRMDELHIQIENE